MNFEGPQALLKSALPHQSCMRDMYGTPNASGPFSLPHTALGWKAWPLTTLFSFLLLDTNRVCEGTPPYLRNHMIPDLTFFFLLFFKQELRKRHRTETELFISTCTYVEVNWCVNLPFFLKSFLLDYLKRLNTMFVCSSMQMTEIFYPTEYVQFQRKPTALWFEELGFNITFPLW